MLLMFLHCDSHVLVMDCFLQPLIPDCLHLLPGGLYTRQLFLPLLQVRLQRQDLRNKKVVSYLKQMTFFNNKFFVGLLGHHNLGKVISLSVAHESRPIA